MLQPFVRFQSWFIPKLKSLHKRWLVSQSYPRGATVTEREKIPVLLSDYDDLGFAKVHLNAVKDDRYAAIIDLENPKHVKKLGTMLQADSVYMVYWSVFESRVQLERRVTEHYRENMMRYISKKLNWHVSGRSTVNPKLEVVFGELHLNLKYGTYDRIRVKFEEIENI